jgi:hypothetical protein
VNLSRTLLFLAAGAALLPAAGLESWHAFDVVPYGGGKLELTVHSQIRTRSRFHEIGMFRFGPIARYSLHPNVRLMGGYYYRDVEDADVGWGDSHRFFFGLENPFRRGRLNVQSRVLGERYFGASCAPYNRFRHRLLAGVGTKTQPFGAVEYYLLAQGLQAIRYVGGVQRRMQHGVRFDLAYYYDRYYIGASRQALVTSLRFDLARGR